MVRMKISEHRYKNEEIFCAGCRCSWFDVVIEMNQIQQLVVDRSNGGKKKWK